VSTRFHHEPSAGDMVTEHCSETGTCLLCVACGWEGHAEVPDAPWYVFRTHACRLSLETAGS
jgi:hypothetical protein